MRLRDSAAISCGMEESTTGIAIRRPAYLSQSLDTGRLRARWLDILSKCRAIRRHRLPAIGMVEEPDRFTVDADGLFRVLEYKDIRDGEYTVTLPLAVS